MFNVHNLEILNFQESTLCHRDHRHHVDAVPAVWGQLLAQPVIHHLLIVDIHWPTFIVIIIMVIAFRLNLHCHSSKHAMYGLLSQSYSGQKFIEEGGAGIYPSTQYVFCNLLHMRLDMSPPPPCVLTHACKLFPSKGCTLIRWIRLIKTYSLSSLSLILCHFGNNFVDS